ncbi:hypothetical protein ACFX5U_15595 [Sphingobacterium sp. SG20118]|uniref:hypothetical protein n=1 Tax=Sphingobacterium sp. SG20118 TaxID=3367156 RepID=UPI0037DFC468
MYWYIFIPAGNDVGDPNQYTRTEGIPTAYNGEKNHLYAIRTNDDKGKPVLSDIELIVEIVNALRSKKDTENVLLRATQ